MKLRAFSLLEVMIAAGLLAIMGTLLAASLSTSITAKEVAEQTSDRYHLARQAMSRMVDEISMAYMSQHISATEPKSKTGFKGERDRLWFTAFGYVPRLQDAKQSEQRELEFKHDLDPRRGTDAILRREQANPDLELDEGGRTQTLLPDVSELEFFYWDPQTEDWKDSWDTESAATQNRLPSRVKIKFTVAVDNDGEEREFVSQARVFIQAPFRFQ
jgi:general secretion pathway protein J